MLDVSAIQVPAGSRAGVLASLVFLSAWWTVQVVGAAPSWHATVTNGAAGVAAPLGRMDAAMASQQGRWAFLHGGYGGSTHTSLLTDLWALDGSTGQWLLLGDVPSTGNTTSPWPLPQAGGRVWPRPRAGHVMVRFCSPPRTARVPVAPRLASMCE